MYNHNNNNSNSNNNLTGCIIGERKRRYFTNILQDILRVRF